MTVSARLKENIDKKLHLLCEIEGLSITKVIEESIDEYFHRHYPVDSPYDIGRDLFGRCSSGKGDLSINGKKYLKKKLREKHKHH